MLRESLLGGPEFMPDAQLAKIDVTARWHEAADRQAGVEARKSVESSPSVSSNSSRVLKTDSTNSRRQIMFTDGNLAELQPTVAEFVKEGGLRERHCMFDTARFGRWTKSMFACFGTESMQSLASQHCARSLSHTAFF